LKSSIEWDRIDFVVTCRLGMERIVASRIKEVYPEAEVVPAPLGFSGLLLVWNVDRARFLEAVRSVTEIERVFPVDAVARASIDEIVGAAKSAVSGRISRGDRFAVRTVRRGSHSFTSIDVNVAVGSAVKEVTGADVDLENPDKVVLVNIVGDYAYISVVPGSEFAKKMKPYKYPMYRVFRLLTVAHEPYLGPPDAAYIMGTRIGREVQTFEVGELVVAPIGAVDAEPLYHFLRGLFEGIESRYEVQRRSYGRDVHRAKVRLQNMYDFVRDRFGQPLIIFEPEGEPISRVARELSDFILDRLRRGKRIYAMVGAREGVPVGLFRYADFVLDVAPGIVISTDYALSSALIALTAVLHERLAEEKPDIEPADRQVEEG